MKPGIILKHEFVEFIPEELEQGTLYITIRFATGSHLCCCGCGNKVVTPIRPTDWKLIFDGKTISLDPSIGNWSFPCHSHYWIRNSRVQWAPKWSHEQIQSGRLHDSYAKEGFFGAADALKNGVGKAEACPKKRGIWQVIRNWFS
jgi:uncharacterized protein DUF6527